MAAVLSSGNGARLGNELALTGRLMFDWSQRGGISYTDWADEGEINLQSFKMEKSRRQNKVCPIIQGYWVLRWHVGKGNVWDEMRWFYWTDIWCGERDCCYAIQNSLQPPCQVPRPTCQSGNLTSIHHTSILKRFHQAIISAVNHLADWYK